MTQPGGVLLGAAAILAAGLTLGMVIGHGGLRPAVAPMPPEARNTNARAVLPMTYPAEVLRVLDGDTFEARIRVWPGMEAVTRVRLRSIDAPEMKARCEDERTKALAARDALSRLLAQGGVGISNVGQDKYGGRIDADVATSQTGNVADALLQAGLARRYDGGRRGSWCDG